MSYKDSLNNTYQIGFYARDAYERLLLAREFNSYIHDHPRSVVRIQQKFEIIINLKMSPLDLLF